MKKIFLLLVVSFFVGKNCEAQNLVPNPSFEDSVLCPNGPGQIYNATGWSSFGRSPDYFNSCSQIANGIVSIPSNVFGFQNASTGFAYSGIAVFVNSGINNPREVIGEELSASLITGTKYYVSVKVSLADSSQFAIDKLGISFSMNPYQDFPDSVDAPLTNHAMIISSIIISDTANWTTISGSFIADSNYNFIMIGNFYTDSQTNNISVPTSSGAMYPIAYYYIDDVCVSPDSLECNFPEGIYNLKETKTSINLYPNPATNQLIVESAKAINTIEITDALGRVQSFKFKVQSPATQIDIHALASGIYFIKVYFGEGAMEVKKFVKE